MVRYESDVIENECQHLSILKTHLSFGLVSITARICIYWSQEHYHVDVFDAVTEGQLNVSYLSVLAEDP